MFAVMYNSYYVYVCMLFNAQVQSSVSRVKDFAEYLSKCLSTKVAMQKNLHLINIEPLQSNIIQSRFSYLSI